MSTRARKIPELPTATSAAGTDLLIVEKVTSPTSSTTSKISAVNFVQSFLDVLSRTGKRLFLASDATQASQIDGGGIVLGASTFVKSITYDLTNNRWDTDAAGLKTKNITLPAGQTISSVNQGIALTTDRGTILFGNHPEIGGVSHFHIMRDNSSASDLFFGDDFNYVKLPATSNFTTVGVVIAASGPSWEFGTDGKIKFPDTTVQQTAWTGEYSPSTPSDWTGVLPVTIEEALNKLAAKVETLKVNYDGGSATSIFGAGDAIFDGGSSSV